MRIPPSVISAFGRAAGAVARHGPELVQCATAALSAQAAHATQAGAAAASAASAASDAGADAPAAAPLRHPPGTGLSQRLQKQAQAGGAGRRPARQADGQDALRAAQEGLKQSIKFNDELMDVLKQAG